MQTEEVAQGGLEGTRPGRGAPPIFGHLLELQGVSFQVPASMCTRACTSFSLSLSLSRCLCMCVGGGGGGGGRGVFEGALE
jgi:hypothetical protein